MLHQAFEIHTKLCFHYPLAKLGFSFLILEVLFHVAEP